MKIRRIFPWLILLLPILFFSRTYYIDKKTEKERFNKQLGKYIIDIKKTNWGKYEDSSSYKGLTLTFNADCTFIYNMKVPFICDSLGKWNTGGAGVEEWNYFYYKTWGYLNYKKNSGDQFDQCCRLDSTFEISNLTPENGQKAVGTVIFKKLNPKSTDLEW